MLQPLLLGVLLWPPPLPMLPCIESKKEIVVTSPLRTNVLIITTSCNILLSITHRAASRDPASFHNLHTVTGWQPITSLLSYTIRDRWDETCAAIGPYYLRRWLALRGKCPPLPFPVCEVLPALRWSTLYITEYLGGSSFSCIAEVLVRAVVALIKDGGKWCSVSAQETEVSFLRSFLYK